MCLYETIRQNTKYQPNKKNKGIAPACHDLRQTTITTGCGWCEECRKKLANEWRIRLYEEIKDNKDCTFISLHFSPEAINKLETEMYIKHWHGLETNDGELETDVNDLAAYAIRMWTERWRKKAKKTPKHWLITELGQNSSERIHLHGIIWGNIEILKKTWQYGNMDIGKYVNEKTINYIMKYVTKLDEKHKGYKQKIFTSKGIGKCYVKKNKTWHEFKEDKTINYYKTYNGIKIGLPRYFKEKIWTEEEREKLWSIQLDKNTTYLKKEEFDKTNEDKIYIKQFDEKLKKARETNENIGYGNNYTGNKKYIITPAMKLKYNELKNLDKTKLVKCVKRREIDQIKKYDENGKEKITKSKNHDEIYYGKYIGNTTEAQRNYNTLIEEAKQLGVSVRVLRLIKEGIIPKPTKL